MLTRPPSDMALPKPLLTVFDIHHKLASCVESLIHSLGVAFLAIAKFAEPSTSVSNRAFVLLIAITEGIQIPLNR